MCGIYFSNNHSEAQAKAKLKKMNFRGPDNLQILGHDNLIFGHVRLSILDLDKRSNQPYVFKNLILTYNGEIYNFSYIKKQLIKKGYSFLTKSDTEVVIKAFHCWKNKFIDRLNGMFSIIIYDKNVQKIYCYRDRLGVKPFYYRIKEGQFEMASNLSVLDHDKSIDEDGLNCYLLSGYVSSPKTIFKDVKKLGAGEEMIIDLKTKKKEINKYWDLEKIEEPVDSDFKTIKKQLRKLIKDAVKIRLNADLEVGAFLSGGIDSPLISAMAQSLYNGKIKTFTVGFNEQAYDESKLAAQYSTIINTDHYDEKISAQDLLNALPDFFDAYEEPFSDASSIPYLILSKKSKKKMTVILGGDGSDESFLGYNHFENLFWFKQMIKIPLLIRRSFAYIIPKNLYYRKAHIIKKILKFKSVDEFIIETFTGGVDYIKFKKNALFDLYKIYLKRSTNDFQKMADFNIKYWLENDSNVKVDRASMYNSLEVRSPFLDYRIVEYARKIPVKYRFRLLDRKRILKKILESFIPRSVFDKPKKGFSVPLNKWTRNELKSDILLSLSKEFLNTIPNFDSKIFLNQMQQHFMNKIDFSRHIWRLYVLAKWCDKKNIKLNK